jgi:hypothetical protein
LRVDFLCDPGHIVRSWQTFGPVLPTSAILDVRLVVDPLTLAKDFRGVSNKLAQLECVECGRVANCFERGWRAYLSPEDEDEPDEQVEVAVYCPASATLEFD